MFVEKEIVFKSFLIYGPELFFYFIYAFGVRKAYAGIIPPIDGGIKYE